MLYKYIFTLKQKNESMELAQFAHGNFSIGMKMAIMLYAS